MPHIMKGTIRQNDFVSTIKGLLSSEEMSSHAFYKLEHNQI